MLGIPVLVAFFNNPVDNPARDVPFNLPTTVADCVPVTSPVKLPEKLVADVAVDALPVILPTIGLVTVKFAKVPTLVKLEPVIVDFKVVPDNVPASRVVQASVPLPVVLKTWLAEPWVFG